MATGSKSRRWLQIFVDVAMLVLFIFLAHPRYTGMGTHAHWSYVLFVLVCVHLVLNKWFFLSLFQGKWPKKRVLMTAINILLLVAILVCYGSIKAIPAHSHLLLYGSAHWTFAASCDCRVDGHTPDGGTSRATCCFACQLTFCQNFGWP
jgi:hypothetical protein